MSKILPRYIRRRFLNLFFFCLFGVVLIFLVVDLVQNLDQFIDRNVPLNITVLYYIYFIPYIVVLIMPVATLMAAVFSVGTLARCNEIVAMKSLGYSLYQMIRTLLGMGIVIAIVSFILSEGLAVHTNRKKMDIEKDYLGKKKGRVASRVDNLVIQEPPNIIISIGTYDVKRETAHRVKIETFQNNHLISKIDAPFMNWEEDGWVVSSGFERIFEYGETDSEMAIPIAESRKFHFQFNPKELLLSQIKPDGMGYDELKWFVDRVRKSGGEVNRWLTELNIRIAYPISNVIIILFSLPLVYNRRKKSLVVGFGISLAICFFYFGLVKIGQTMGEKGSVVPFIAAWLGNGLMGMLGVGDLIRTRK